PAWRALDLAGAVAGGVGIAEVHGEVGVGRARDRTGQEQQQAGGKPGMHGRLLRKGRCGHYTNPLPRARPAEARPELRKVCQDAESAPASLGSEGSQSRSTVA